MDTDMQLFNELEERLHAKDDIIADLLVALDAVIDSFYCNNGLVGSITITEAEEAMRKARGG